MAQRVEIREYTHFHLFSGCGGGAKGFNKGTAKLGMREARFRCVGGVDVDPDAIADFNKMAGVKGTVLDLFSREQYTSFHGREPAASWRQATPADIRRAANDEFPDIVFLSAPCKGFSGLLSETTSQTGKYQALNELTLRGVWLMCEAFKDCPPKLVIFENVPRIMNRGRKLLDLIKALLRSYGYAVAESKHNCGEIGNLAQSRERFLLVARHIEQVPNFLYEPEKFKLRGVGEVLDLLPMPGDPMAGPMHRIPNLQWKTWVRLAFVEAGSDWRSLQKLNVTDDGYLADYLIVPEYHSGYLGVNRWDDSCGVVAGRSTPSNGNFSVADPRAPAGVDQYGQYGVNRYDEATGVVTSQRSPGQGKFSVADPRHAGPDKFHNQYRIAAYSDAANAVTGASGKGQCVQDPRSTQGPNTHHNKFRIVPYDRAAGAITGADRVGSGAPCVQDPRPAPRDDYKQTKYRITGYEEPAGTVIAASTTGNGAFAVADPKPDCLKEERDHYNTQGHYGVLGYDQPSKAVPGFAKNNNGSWSVADERESAGIWLPESDIILPGPKDSLICIIRALDNTWHRPFTTLELAALQSLIDPADPETWCMVGNSDSAWRERIGNAVPPDAAAAIAGVMGMTLLMAEAGETFMLSSVPIWVRPVALALSVDTAVNQDLV